MSKHEQRRRQWQALVARFERSGRSQAVFAAEAGVGLPAFRYWLYKVRAASDASALPSRSQAAEPRESRLRLLPVEIQRAPSEGQAIEVDVVSLRLQVTGSADPRYVASLVVALREISRC